MAQYLIYPTRVGRFTVIVGDDAYNFFNTVSTGQIVNSSGEVTELGATIKASGYLENIVATHLYSSDILPGNLSEDVWDVAKYFIPNNYRAPFNITGVETDYLIDCLTGENVQFMYRMKYFNNEPAYMSISRFTPYKNGAAMGSYIAPNNFMPIGRTGVTSSNTARADEIFEHILVINSSYTAAVDARFTFRDPNLGAVKNSNYSRTAPTSAELNRIAAWLGLQTPQSIDVPDPYSPGGESDTGGGEGDFDGTSTPVDFATLPTLSAVDTGFITLYNPSVSQLQSLSSYMWSSAFDVDTFKKLFADPMDAILGLSIVPGPVPSGSTVSVKVGNRDTGVQMTKAASQYIDVDCGTLNVNEFWGAYLDYEPYTKAELYLPFIGVHQIAVDDIMDKPMHIKYHVDLLSGACVCEIKCGDSVLYTFIGACSVSIPVTGNDWTNVINGVVSAATAIGTLVATGGSSAPSAVGAMASAAVNSLKPNVEKSGSISGAGGILAGLKPVLILTRPRQALPAGQNSYTGYPAFVTRQLGSLTGYTEVFSIKLSGIDATDSELDEIVELLKGGVIL